MVHQPGGIIQAPQLVRQVHRDGFHDEVVAPRLGPEWPRGMDRSDEVEGNLWGNRETWASNVFHR